MIAETEQIYNLDPLLNRVKHRVTTLNKNWLAIFTGATGSGKSWSALSIAEQLDPEFTTDNIVFSATQFIEFLKNSEKIKAGSVVMWDESGVGLGSRDAMTKINRLIGSYLQSFRSRNTILIFTLPTLSMLDRQARQLAHAILETKSIDRETKECIVKWFDVQTNALSGKSYLKHPRIFDNGIIAIKKVRIKAPSVILRNRYEQKKADFLDSLINDIDRKMNPKEIMKKAKEDLNEYINSLALRVRNETSDKYLNTRKNYDWKSIKFDLTISDTIAIEVAKRANKLKKNREES